MTRVLTTLLGAGMVGLASFAAMPATASTAQSPGFVSAAQATPSVQDVRWVTRCRTVWVVRRTPYGPRRVPVRQCGRVWVRY